MVRTETSWLVRPGESRTEQEAMMKIYEDRIFL